jgi:hypothetical protein
MLNIRVRLTLTGDGALFVMAILLLLGLTYRFMFLVAAIFGGNATMRFCIVPLMMRREWRRREEIR